MSTRFFRTLLRVKINPRHFCHKALTQIHKLPQVRYNKIVVPSVLGFSIFTWLGFEKEKSVEDELIDTIKHCVYFIEKTEYEKAEQLLHVALRQAQQVHHELGITYVYDVMANLALERLQLEKAKKLFVTVSQRLMSDGATEEDLRVVHISIKLARIEHLAKAYTTAQLGYDWCLEKLHASLEKDPSDGIKKLIALTEDWYGRLFLECNKLENALNFMTNALNKMREIPDVEQEHIVIQLNDIGTVYDRLGNADESITYFKEAIELANKLNMDELGAFYVNLGRAYLKKRLVADARKSCGFAWRLGVTLNNNEIKDEAEDCINQIKMMK